MVVMVYLSFYDNVLSDYDDKTVIQNVFQNWFYVFVPVQFAKAASWWCQIAFADVPVVADFN